MHQLKNISVKKDICNQIDIQPKLVSTTLLFQLLHHAATIIKFRMLPYSIYLYVVMM